MTFRKIMAIAFVLPLTLVLFSCTGKKKDVSAEDVQNPTVTLNLTNVGTYTKVDGGPCSVCPNGLCDNCKTGKNPNSGLKKLKIGTPSASYPLNQNFIFYGKNKEGWTKIYTIYLDKNNCQNLGNSYQYDVDIASH